MVNASQILQQIKNAVTSSNPDATLILYGSYARCEQTSGSDIDILVLLNQDRVTYNDWKKIGSPLYRLERETGVMISPVIFSKKAWEARHRISDFYKNVLKDGKVL